MSTPDMRLRAARRPDDASAPSRRGAVRAADVAATVGWLLFFGLWWRTLRITEPAVLVQIGLFLLAVLVGSLAATTIWIHHNLAIHRRKGPRRSVPVVDARRDRDFMGRSLDADWDAARSATYVLVAPSGGRKLFRPVDAPPADAAVSDPATAWIVPADTEPDSPGGTA